MPSVPPTMRAWTQTQRGTPSRVLALSKSVSTPTISSPNQVIVRITHAALNPGGSIMMQLCPFIFRHNPAIPEMDLAGTIYEVGASVREELTVGTPVFGSITVPEHIKNGSGSLADYAILDSSTVIPRPRNLSSEDAAGLAVAGSTALALIDAAKLKSGDSVLVNGASGGIGSMVVQLAKREVGESGRVVAICSGRNEECIRSLGADEVIDYTAHSPTSTHLAATFSKLRFSVIIDCFGVQDIFNHSASYLAEGKAYVSVGPAFHSYTYGSVLYSVGLMMQNALWPSVLGGVQRSYVQVTGLVTQQSLNRLSKLVEEGKLKAVLDGVWDMQDVLEAYEKVLSRHSRGKVVVKVQEEI